jgi:hypothetical protein
MVPINVEHEGPRIKAEEQVAPPQGDNVLVSDVNHEDRQATLLPTKGHSENSTPPERTLPPSARDTERPPHVTGQNGQRHHGGLPPTGADTGETHQGEMHQVALAALSDRIPVNSHLMRDAMDHYMSSMQQTNPGQQQQQQQPAQPHQAAQYRGPPGRTAPIYKTEESRQVSSPRPPIVPARFLSSSCMRPQILTRSARAGELRCVPSRVAQRPGPQGGVARAGGHHPQRQTEEEPRGA